MARAVEDLSGFLRIGRDLGMIGIEYVGQYNLGDRDTKPFGAIR